MANNVISQVKIGSSTYDIKDNHMIFRDIYYRGTASTITDTYSTYTIGVQRLTDDINTKIGENTSWMGRMWIQTGKAVGNETPNYEEINKNNFKYFSKTTWKNYKAKNLYLGTKFVFCNLVHSFFNIGPHHVQVIGKASRELENGTTEYIKLECIQLYLEQGTINHFCDAAFATDRDALRDDTTNPVGTLYSS